MLQRRVRPSLQVSVTQGVTVSGAQAVGQIMNLHTYVRASGAPTRTLAAQQEEAHSAYRALRAQGEPR